MHDAYNLSQLVKLQVPIESIAAFGDNLFVGTKVGHLLIYCIARKAGEMKYDVQLLNYNKQFSKKPIQQLDVIPEHEVLVSLTDNLVTFHNFYKTPSSATLKPTALPQTKGATFFTLNISNQVTQTGETKTVILLLVIVKRKMQEYFWKSGSFHSPGEEISLPDVPRSAVIGKGSIVLGFKSEYCIYDNVNREFRKLFPIGSAPEPSLTSIDNDTLAVGKDSQSILINSQGDSASQYRISWTEQPAAVIFDKPFLIGGLSNAIEIRTVEPNMLIQKLSCDRGTIMARARQGVVFIASSSYVWCLQAVSIHHQIKSLLQDQQFELAIRIAKDCEHENEEEQKKKVHDVQTLYAYHLFDTKQFKESMSQFLALDTKPYDVIKLYPELLPAAKSAQSKLADHEVEEGLSALIVYLLSVRRKLPNVKSNLLSVIDTTLLKCYIQINDAMIAPLLRLKMVHFQEAEQVLKKHNKLSELVILYDTNELHPQALALLKQQGNIKRTIEYLQHLGPDHLPLLLEYAEWVLQKNPEEGLKIFTEDTTEVEQLPRPKILKFILETQRDLAVPYLECAMKLWDDKNPILHTTLADLYREKYQALQELPECQQEASKLRSKFLEFLERSDCYSTQAVLDCFPKKDMLEERAIVLGKQGRHEQALSIYVCLLDDIQRAKQYCERVWAKKSAGHEEVYVLLLRILLSPPENWLADIATTSVTKPPDLSAAMEILSTNSSKMDPSQVLAVLPDNIAIGDIRKFLKESIHSKLVQRREAQVLKGLVYSENLQVHDQRMRCEARAVNITDLHVCVICSKRFTNQSVFALTTEGVVHYGCLKEKPYLSSSVK